MMSCQQATRRIASDQFADAGWRSRLAVRLHLAMCRHCRCYAAQLAAIGGVARSLSRQDPAPSPDLEQALLKRCLGKRDTQAPESK